MTQKKTMVQACDSICGDDQSASRAGVRVPPFMARRRHGMNGQWPLQDFLELGALVSAVPCARLHARHVLREWGLARLGDSTELLVAELVTNAVQASRAAAQASSVRLWLASDSAQVLILVWDASPDPPARITASDEAENGRGLMLVEAISEQWGWSSTRTVTANSSGPSCRHYQPAVRLNPLGPACVRRRDRYSERAGIRFRISPRSAALVRPAGRRRPGALTPCAVALQQDHLRRVVRACQPGPSLRTPACLGAA